MKKLILMILLASCIKNLSNLKINNKDINEDLIIAINNNDKDKVIYLINNDANVNYSFGGKYILEIALDNFNYVIIDIIKDKYKLKKGMVDNNKYFLLSCYT